MRFAPARGGAALASVLLVCGVAAAAPATAADPSPIGAGYLAFLQSGNVGSVGATFKVPSFTCTSGADQEMMLPGVFVFDGTGGFTEAAAVSLHCDGGTRTRGGVIRAGGAFDQSLSVNSGDKVEVAVYETPTRTVGRIYDRTQHTSAQAIGAAAPNDALVFVGDLGPGALDVGTVVPTFTKVAFSTVTINGQYLTDANPSAFDMNTNGDTQVQVGAITGGTHFVTKFVQNS